MTAELQRRALALREEARRLHNCMMEGERTLTERYMAVKAAGRTDATTWYAAVLAYEHHATALRATLSEWKVLNETIETFLAKSSV